MQEDSCPPKEQNNVKSTKNLCSKIQKTSSVSSISTKNSEEGDSPLCKSAFRGEEKDSGVNIVRNVAYRLVEIINENMTKKDYGRIVKKQKKSIYNNDRQFHFCVGDYLVKLQEKTQCPDNNGSYPPRKILPTFQNIPNI